MVDLGDDKETKRGGERERKSTKERGGREREREGGRGRGFISVDRRSVYHSTFM